MQKRLAAFEAGHDHDSADFHEVQSRFDHLGGFAPGSRIAAAFVEHDILLVEGTGHAGVGAVVIGVSSDTLDNAHSGVRNQR